MATRKGPRMYSALFIVIAILPIVVVILQGVNKGLKTDWAIVDLLYSVVLPPFQAVLNAIFAFLFNKAIPK